MIRQSIARRYAKALFAVGEKDGKYRDYLKEMGEIVSAVEGEPRLKKALLLPFLEMDRRKDVLSDFIKVLSLSPPVVTLLGLLLDRDRMGYLSLIHSAYEDMVDEKEGRVKGVGYSAYPLSEELKARIEEALGERLRKKVRLDIKEDKDLIGGIKVIVGGMRIDGSVKRQLELLNKSMLKE